MVDVVVVAGARPNFVKVKPLLDALQERSISACLVHTGQHYDQQLSQIFFDELGIRNPDHSLEVGSGSHAEQTAAVMIRFEGLLGEIRPKAVVVVGDVNSTVACALVAAKCGAFVVHVEAGLRSRDWAMPEEVNRVVTDRLSDLLLAPSRDAVDNLRLEGYRDHQIALVGNVMIDSLLANLDRARSREKAASLGLRPKQFALVTLHRPSNVDNHETLGMMLRALETLSLELPVVFPAHPRTRAGLGNLSLGSAVHVIDPLGYLDFISLEADAAVVITDSGGVQEETSALGVPCVTARDSTERPITVTEGTNTVAGSEPDAVLAAARAVLQSPPKPRCPALWDGRAGGRCVDAIVQLLDNPDWPRPTATFAPTT